MFQWASGDGYLMIKYPRYTYYNLPTFPVYFMIGLVTGHAFIFVVTEFVSRLIWVLVIHKWWYNSELSRVLEHKTWLDKALIVGSSTIADNCSEFGHLWCFIRNQRLDLCVKRFDWSLGTMSIGYERLKAVFQTVLLLFATVITRGIRN
jgi:hypothetical protein